MSRRTGRQEWALLPFALVLFGLVAAAWVVWPVQPKTAPVVSPIPTKVVAGPRQPTWDPNDLAGTAKLICLDCGEHLQILGGGIVFQLPYSTVTFSQNLSDCRSLNIPKGAMVMVRREPGQGRLATTEEVAALDARPSPNVQVIHLVGPQGVRNVIVQLGKPEPMVGPGETGTVCFARFDRDPFSLN